ncbi:uncharacterized protein A1O9_08038 [Exophiala aquamarina CBS 119918]|uniref:Fungal N-terminal domain-containing protein n=1 Tax=Exophiala aquamarina CBS 119918 TaxID=1182545 RepID=A0A072P9L5_9EURO|nr:uncharacterized protein A1O9_08038 [Exophiala aquamarina CBS 119918]KEF56457.1 hypothetical protein A1O9_08038 [Exophiala aquamarina CBS 119918]
MVETEFISTIAGIASAGTKLSVTLYTFSETISTDHRYIKSIAQDVSLASSLLSQLDEDLKADDQPSLYSTAALETAKEAVKECEDVFNEIRAVLEDAAELALQRPTKGRLTLSPLERSKWAFAQPRMVLLMANLQKLKSTLVLVQNALNYADNIESGSETQIDERQKSLLEIFARANQEATKRYEAVRKAAERSDGGIQSLTDGSTAAAANLSSLIKIPTPGDHASDNTAEAESTVQECLDRIENALDRIAQSNPTAISDSSTVAVMIELEKELNRSQPNLQQRSKPRVTLSIVQKQGPKAKLQEAAAIARRNSVGRSTQGLGRSNSRRTQAMNSTWYSTAWNSLPSFQDTISFLQEARNDTSSYFGVEAVTEDVQSVYEPYKREIYSNDNGNYELPRFNAPVTHNTSPDSPTVDYFGQASSSQGQSDLVPEPYAPPRARLASRSRSPPYEGKGKQRAGGPKLEAEVKATEDQGLLADGDDSKAGSDTEKKWNQDEDQRLKTILDSSINAAITEGEKAEPLTDSKGKGKASGSDSSDKDWTTV